MKPSDYKISLDILESQSQYSLPMKKGDTARVVYITLREGGVPYEIGTDCFAVLSGRKPDGTVLENNCVIKGNTIIYEITPQTTAVSGLVDCAIKLYGVDNGLICSSRFSIIVDERVVGDEEIESTPEFSALTKLYSNVVASENARVVAETGRVEAEKARESAEDKRAVAEAKRELDTTEAIADAEEATERANDIANTLQDKLDKGEFKGDKGDKGDMPTNVANAIKNTVSGNPIVIDDVSPIEHSLDIKANANETVYVRGKNLIPFDNKAYYDGRYKAGQTYEKNGVNFTINDDGSVYAKGTATETFSFQLFSGGTFSTGVHTVTLSGSPNGSSITTYMLRLRNTEGASGVYDDFEDGITVHNTNITKSSIAIIVISGAIIDATFYPMLEIGDTVSGFVPPTDTQSVIADENGVVSGLVSVANEMSIFTETYASIECTYNQDTEKAVDKIDKYSNKTYSFNFEELKDIMLPLTNTPIITKAIIKSTTNTNLIEYQIELFVAEIDTKSNSIKMFFDLPIYFAENFSIGNAWEFSPMVKNYLIGNYKYNFDKLTDKVSEYITNSTYKLYANSIMKGDYKLDSLKLSWKLEFANENIRNAFYNEFSPILSATTDFLLEHNNSKIINCDYIGG